MTVAEITVVLIVFIGGCILTLQEIKNIIGVKPYFETENGVLYNADCLEIMAKMPDKCIDLVLTDPPYGVGLKYDCFNDTEENVRILVHNAIPLALKKTQRLALTCATRQITFYPKSDWIICWFNKAGAGMNPWGFTCWQPILVYGKDPYLQNKMGSRPDYIEHSETSRKLDHPCPKPDKFWLKLLKRCSVLSSDLIFDPFLGSGTTAVACEKLNRKWIGIEISEKYCEIAAKRIKAEADQIKLF